MAKAWSSRSGSSPLKVVAIYAATALAVGGLIALSSPWASAQGISEVGASTTFFADNNPNPSTALPARTTAGDALVTYIETYPWVTVTCPKGWSKVIDSTNGSMTRLTGCVVIATANQPKPVARMSPQTAVVMVTTAFSGVDTSHPVDTAAVADSLTSPSVVTSAPGDELIFGEASSAWRAVARAPAGTVLGATINNRGNSQVAMAFTAGGRGGSTRNGTWKVSDSQWHPVAATIALRAAGAQLSPSDPPPSPTTAPPTTAPPTTAPPTTAPPTTAAPTTAPATTTTVSVTTAPPSNGGNCTTPSFTTSDPSGTVNEDPNDGEYWWVDNDAWSASPGPQTLYVCNQSSWYAVSNQPNIGGQVETYPNTEYDVGGRANGSGVATAPITSYNSILSTFSEAFPSAGTWDAGYDLWTDNWTNETMIWNQWAGSQSYWAGVADTAGTALTLDGVPYHFYCNGSSSDCSPAGNHANAEMMFFRDTQTSSGTVDLLAAFQWEVAHGYARAGDIPTQLEYGVEICATNGTETFPLTGLTFSVG